MSTLEGRKNGTFSQGDTVAFTVSVKNKGTVAGSHVPQVSRKFSDLKRHTLFLCRPRFHFPLWLPVSYTKVDLPLETSGIIRYNAQ
jgi:hypothetical protein